MRGMPEKSRRVTPSRIALTIPALLLVLFLHPREARPCGPYFYQAFFGNPRVPHKLSSDFSKGRMGIIHGDFKYSHLVVAYRHVAGIGFNRREHQELKRFWEYGGFRDRWTDVTGISGFRAWEKIRTETPGLPPFPDPGMMKNMDGRYYGGYLNCPHHAFAAAAKALAERRKRYGAHARYRLIEWVKAQDMVFSNCSGTKADIPDLLRRNASREERADRDYQIAAAYLYAELYDRAARKYSLIAADQKSPWRLWAPYLRTRALLRRATMRPVTPNKKLINEAASLLDSLQRSRKHARLHHAAHEMHNLVLLRGRTELLIRKLGPRLLRRHAGTFRGDLHDFSHALNRYARTGPDHERPAMKQSGDIRKDKLTDWLITYRSPDPAAAKHALKRYRATRSRPWLLAAISKISPNHASAPRLLRAARAVPASSAAYITVLYHRIRILTERSPAGARTLYGTNARRIRNLSRSDRNAFRILAAFSANRSRDFIQSGAIRASGFGETGTFGRQEPYSKTLKKLMGERWFPRSIAWILSRDLTADAQSRLSGTSSLPPRLRKRMARVAFVKAVLLKQDRVAARAARALITLDKKLKADLRVYRSIRGADRRRLAGLRIILKHPGLVPYVQAGIGRTTPLEEIDNFRHNWWCRPGRQGVPDAADMSIRGNPEVRKFHGGLDLLTPRPAFLSAKARRAGQREWNALRTMGSAPNALATEIIAYAKKYPQAKHIPEALHRVVKTTRFGCATNETSALSKRAFRLLHLKYRRSPWTKKTPYHY